MPLQLSSPARHPRRRSSSSSFVAGAAALMLLLLLLMMMASTARAFFPRQPQQPPRLALIAHQRSTPQQPAAAAPWTTATAPLFSSSSSSSSEGDEKSSKSSSMVPSSSSGLSGALETFQENLPDLSRLLEARGSIWSNIVEGEVGRRGEVYAAAQFVILVCIARGTVPIIGGAVSILCGPGLLLLGLFVMLGSAAEMGPALSPWPVPSLVTENPTALLTQGWLYGSVRHPMYAGLLAACAGFSVATGDVTRLLLTALLWYTLDVKTAREEAELRAAFGADEYDRYRRDVPGKFVPHHLLARLPWTPPPASDKKDN